MSAQTPSEKPTAVDRLMKRCQVGVGGRNALNDAHDIMAECYGTLGRLQAELAAAKAQLPAEMQDCTILFKECKKGHGQLTATNWIQHPCVICELAAAKARVVELESELAKANNEFGSQTAYWPDLWKRIAGLKEQARETTERDQLRATVARQAEEIERLGKDAERLEWVLPIVTGDDDAETNRHTLSLAACLVLGLDGRAAIDAALAKEPRK